MKYIIGLLVVVILVTKLTSPTANPYTGAAETVVGAIGEDIRRETSEGMREAGALPNPRDPITTTSPEPSASGTTTKSDTVPAWVEKESTSSGEELWKPSPVGAPKTSTWDKVWGLTVYGDGAILLLTVRDSASPTGRSNKQLLWDSKGGSWLIRPDGVNRDKISRETQKAIFGETLELGLRPVEPTSKIRAIFRFTPNR